MGLTKHGVEEREIPQVGGILWQSEKTPRDGVPHQAAAGRVLQNPILDDLSGDRAGRVIKTVYRGNILEGQGCQDGGSEQCCVTMKGLGV